MKTIEIILSILLALTPWVSTMSDSVPNEVAQSAVTVAPARSHNDYSGGFQTQSLPCKKLPIVFRIILCPDKA